MSNYNKDDLKRDICLLHKIDVSNDDIGEICFVLMKLYNNLSNNNDNAKIMDKIYKEFSELEKETNRILQYVEELRAVAPKEEFDG